MYFEYQNLVTKTNVNQQTQTEVKPHGVVTSEAISLVSLGFVIGWAGLFLMLSKMTTVGRFSKINVNTNYLHKVRCKKCQFFSNNRYLNCAVQPGIVLTKEAENCPDYCPSNDKFRQ